MKKSIFKFVGMMVLVLPIVLLGCSGGSDSTVIDTTPVKSSQSIKVFPSDYNFGSVTPGNSPEPLEVEILNNGLGDLSISGITLSDSGNFTLDLNGGLIPCGVDFPRTIVAGETCNASVTFNPDPALKDAELVANLTISSNDPVAPTINVSMTGKVEPINALFVRINQVNACPRPEIKAYVSVTDQGGYPVKGLESDVNNFEIIEEGVNIGSPDDPVEFAESIVNPISVALLMDFSRSITNVEDALQDMQDSAANFIDQLNKDDRAEIIKFADVVDVEQPWQYGTDEGKNNLINAIYAPYDNGEGETDLYDAVVKAVDDIVDLASQDRKAVIVISDGRNDEFLSDNPDLVAVINHAQDNGVPIFTIAIGDPLLVDFNVLEDLADLTGGQSYTALSSDNLRTIYQQLADVLFKNQYVLTYTSVLGDGVLGDLTIKATYQTIVGENLKNDGIASCLP